MDADAVPKSKIGRCLKKERKQLELLCRENGIVYFYTEGSGCLDVISKNGRWKIVEENPHNRIWLYHKNLRGQNPDDFVLGYHDQNVCRHSLMAYFQYIINHDKYREENPMSRPKKKRDRYYYRNKKLMYRRRMKKMMDHFDSMLIVAE